MKKIRSREIVSKHDPSAVRSEIAEDWINRQKPKKRKTCHSGISRSKRKPLKSDRRG